MKIWDVMSACRRFWPIVVAGLLFSAAVSYEVYQAPGVYLSQVNVVLLLPSSARTPNTLQTTSSSLINTAAVLQRSISGVQVESHPFSGAVTLASEGIKHGSLVRLPNSGSQWTPKFDQPILNVQAVGTTAIEAQTTMNAVLAKIKSTLDGLQSSAKVYQRNLIQAQLSPPQPDLFYVAGSAKRAAAVALMLGIGVTLAVVIVVDRRFTAMQSRRQRHAPLVS